MSNQNEYIFDTIGKLLTSSEIVSGLINMLEAFDDYEERKTEKQSDKQLLQSALVLYKQGRINRDQFLDICSTLCPEKPIQGYEDKAVNTLFEEIERRKQQ